MEALAHITTPEFAVAFVVSFIAAAVQSTVGFGFALLSVPLLSLLNPLFAPVPQLIVVFPLTLAIVLRERHAVEFRSTLWTQGGYRVRSSELLCSSCFRPLRSMS
ncbi:MAG: hypothetical protein JRD92_08650 [Deltaproteobacteria bacterium]|nr:hypothetical protein [Deltaproteobacteria bacterium]